MRVLILSTSAFSNRILSKSFFDTLSRKSEVEVWGYKSPPFLKRGVEFKLFPKVQNNREWINILRQINELAWARVKNLTSILSMKKFNSTRQPVSFTKRLINVFSYVVNIFRLETKLDELVKRVILTQNRSSEARSRIKAFKPDLVLVTNPFWMLESSVAIEAKKLGIRVVSLIPSWDNITTKSRMTFESDYYYVWSDLRVKELRNIYPKHASNSISEYGTPQYECFHDYSLHIERNEFCLRYNLDPNKKIILYTTGSPNFLPTEYDGVEKFAIEFKANKRFDDCQLLIRPHPNKDNNDLVHLHDPENFVFVQNTENVGLSVENRNFNLDEITLWINTFKHCNVLINLSSTSTLDALAFDKPVININYDPNVSKDYESFIKEINSTWKHLEMVYACAEIPQVENLNQLIEETLYRLRYPNKGLDKRRALFKLICGNPKQQLGSILADRLFVN